MNKGRDNEGSCCRTLQTFQNYAPFLLEKNEHFNSKGIKNYYVLINVINNNVAIIYRNRNTGSQIVLRVLLSNQQTSQSNNIFD